MLYGVLLVSLVGAGAYYRFVLSKKGDAESPERELASRPTAPTASTNRAPASSGESPLGTPSAAPSEAVVESAVAADEKDADLNQALASLLGETGAKALFKSDYIARRIVLTIDGMTHKKQTQADYLAFHNPRGAFKPGPPANYRRYKPYVTIFRSIDLNAVVATYRQYYPLLQAAYRELDPRREFNDRLVEVIDHLLEDPFAKHRAPQLDRTNSAYRFQDPELEGLSSGQKMLFRMGPANASDVRLTLRNLRLLLQR